MNTWMLWYDGSKTTTFAKKVEQAALYFKKKYGRTPELCVINDKEAGKLPADTPNPVIVDGRHVAIRSWRGVVPGHFCLGFDVETLSQPEPKEPEKSGVVSAFERHARKATVQA